MTTKLHVVFGAGQVGAPLVNELLARKERVRVVRRSKVAVPAGVELVTGDAFDPGFTRAAVQGATTVYHCLNVAYTTKAWREQLPTLQRHVLDGAAAVGARLVVFENLYAYGLASPINEASPIAPVSHKGRLRAELSEQLFQAHARGRVEVVVGRASNLFGPGVTQSQVGEHLFSRVLGGGSAQLFGDPTRLHSYSYAPDVGRALALLGLADSSLLGRAHVLPVMPALSNEVFHRALFSALERPARIERVPKLLLRLLGAFNPALKELVEMNYEWEHDYVVDDQRFVSHFDFKRTSLEQALSDTAQWWKGRLQHADAAPRLVAVDR